MVTSSSLPPLKPFYTSAIRLLKGVSAYGSSIFFWTAFISFRLKDQIRERPLYPRDSCAALTIFFIYDVNKLSKSPSDAAIMKSPFLSSVSQTFACCGDFQTNCFPSIIVFKDLQHFSPFYLRMSSSYSGSGSLVN